MMFIVNINQATSVIKVASLVVGNRLRPTRADRSSGRASRLAERQQVVVVVVQVARV